MSSRPSGEHVHLSIPRKSTELEDDGAHDLSSDDEHFSDASEGQRQQFSRPITPVSPIPTTRVEKVDDDPRHGDIPGTTAYRQRSQDAVPDEIEVVPEGTLSRRSSRYLAERPTTPGGTPIPRTVVEKVDPASPSHGEVPGTAAYRQRLADSAPDVVLQNTDPATGSKFQPSASHNRNLSTASIPETIVTRVDDKLSLGEVPGSPAAAKRTQDALPDRTEIKSDDADDADITSNPTAFRRRSTLRSNHDTQSAQDTGFGDDFDDFEEGDQAAADEDFGDFDDFEQGTDDQIPDSEPPPPTHVETSQPVLAFPLLDPSSLSSLSSLLESTRLHLDAMFPTTTEQSSSQPEPIPAEPPIFPTERSRSLWKQLITPPPLRPPNWTQSRIRRLFLISLGVPVDLDEILPPSKQKKLILPDINLPPSKPSTDNPELDSIAKLRNSKTNDSNTSLDSNQSASTKRGRSRPSHAKAAQPPPPLDLVAVKRICSTTDEKLQSLTDEELKAHIKELESLTEKTSTLLEYWLRRRDGLRKEKEAFEGVIENLVRHAKRVRTIR